ncbi:MAG: ATP-binding cassette domain-containing protein [Lachnospiraceae bacterium]|nr:ATP-binding cassette domain-containing protein [Lachnospiraceae bacterium]
MIEIRNLTKTFATNDGSVEALKGINLSIPDGVVYGVIGMSGAGKSTLVRCMNLLEVPTEGQVLYQGTDLAQLSAKELREKRREISMIFQGFHLLMQRTVLSNVCFPLELIGTKKDEAEKRAMELLKMVGLEDKANVYPAQLSGGQQQRVAIARALATEPKVLLCDEATSALDPATTNSILELIRSLQQQLNLTVVVITHQMSVIEKICQYVVILENGAVAEEGPVEEVFSRPKSRAAKKLVYPDESADGGIIVGPGEHFLRVIYNGSESARKPLIAQLARDTGILANIAYASTKSVNERAFGTMILSIKGSQEDADKAMEWMKTVEGIIVEEVNEDVN